MSIPKVIHYCWFGRGDIPERDKKCIESWRKYCPDYEIIQWNEDNYDVTQVPYMKEAYEAKRWGFVPDFARMDIVYRYGGIYLDTDVELIKSLDGLLENHGFAGREAPSGCIALGLGFGAEKNLPILKEWCDYYRKLRFIDEDGKPNLKPNPIILEEYINKMGVIPEDTSVNELLGITILPPEYLCPQDYLTGRTKVTANTYSIHHYHASWQTEQEKQTIREYQRFTRSLGEKYGELAYQFYKVIREQGIIQAVKKIVGFLRK